jgi:hypothetical protein
MKRGLTRGLPVKTVKADAAEVGRMLLMGETLVPSGEFESPSQP